MAQRDNFSEFDDDLGDPTRVLSKPEQKPEPVPAADYEKIKQERDTANRLRDEAIKGMLAGSQQSQVQQQEPAPAPAGDDEFLKKHLPDDVDQDVLALLSPVLRAQRDVIEQDVQQKYGHIAETVERDENLKVIASRVDGFSPELLPEIKQLYDALPVNDREEYDNRLGIEILARRVLENKRGRSDMSGMAFSETPAAPTEKTGGTSEQDIWDMPDDQFETLMHNVKMGKAR